jgi:hypothetical protein
MHNNIYESKKSKTIYNLKGREVLEILVAEMILNSKLGPSKTGRTAAKTLSLSHLRVCH